MNLRNISIKQKLNLTVMLTTAGALLLALSLFVARDMVIARNNMSQDLSITASYFPAQK